MAITQIEKLLYTAKTHTTGGREGGSSRTSDGHLDVKISIPGTPGAGTNPEQLFAAGWSACFLSAVKIVAAHMKVKLPQDVAVDAEVDLGATNSGGASSNPLEICPPRDMPPEVPRRTADAQPV